MTGRSDDLCCVKIVYCSLSKVKLIIWKLVIWKDVNRDGIGVRFITSLCKLGPTQVVSMEEGKVGWGHGTLT